MARWKLTSPHYLNVPGTTWEYKETDRKTGRPKRTIFDVPMHLDPTQEFDWTEKDGDEGIIVVCHNGKGQPKDITFIGNPTMDMIPLDDEAKAISAKVHANAKPATEGIAYSESLIAKFQGEMDEVQRKRQQQENAAAASMSELLGAMAGMMKQNQELITLMAKQNAPAPAGLKRA